MEIAEHLKEKVREATSKSLQFSAKAKEASDNSKKAKRESKKLYESMNFRERNLGGFLGGDRKKVAEYHEYVELIELYDELSDAARSKSRDYDKQVWKVIDSYLRSNDPAYQALLKPYQAADKAKQAVDEFLEEIDGALCDVNGAQGMETIDLVSSSKFVSMMSYASNSSASDAIASVKRATPAFQKAVNNYNDALKDFKTPGITAEIGDGIDLVLDMALDGFDLMSIFTLSALGDAEDQLENMQTEVERVEGVISKNLYATKSAMNAYVQQVRIACIQ